MSSWLSLSYGGSDSDSAQPIRCWVNCTLAIAEATVNIITFISIIFCFVAFIVLEMCCESLLFSELYSIHDELLIQSRTRSVFFASNSSSDNSSRFASCSIYQQLAKAKNLPPYLVGAGLHVCQTAVPGLDSQDSRSGDRRLWSKLLTEWCWRNVYEHYF